jgi:hypothetical protein
MRIIYQTQLPGKPPKETRIGGWVAAIVGALILIGVFALLIFLLPFFLLAIVGFIALIVFLIIAGWVYLGFKIGFRDLWEITSLLFGFGGSRLSWDERRSRVKKEWENRSKGKPGVWS